MHRKYVTLLKVCLTFEKPIAFIANALIIVNGGM